MRLFFASSENPQFYRSLRKTEAKNMLASYYYLKKKSLVLEDLDKVDLFIDSGGFSARNNDATIDVKEYANFLKTLNNKYFCCANLDTLSLEESKENEKYLKSQGLRVLPVYHPSEFEGEDREVLFEYIENNEYIAVGGVANSNLGKARTNNYLNYVFKHTKDKTKVHGFGINNWELLKKYPFYSVDATSWTNPQRWGQHFDFKAGKLNRVDGRKPSMHRFFDKEQQLVNSINSFLEAEHYITKLWEKRGIKWE